MNYSKETQDFINNYKKECQFIHNQIAEINSKIENLEREASIKGLDVLSKPKIYDTFEQFYRKAEFDINELISIRKQWDQYINEAGTRIPGMFLKAPLNPSQKWKKYLVQ